MIPFYELFRIDKSTETERLVVARGCGEKGMGNDSLMGMQFPLG